MRFVCDRSAPRRVREALERLEAIEPVHDDALLVASELATNAVRHSRQDGDGEFELLAEIVPDGLRIEVTDTYLDDHLGGPRLASEEEPDALGLRIVQQLARRWGAERFDGQRMWAVLAM